MSEDKPRLLIVAAGLGRQNPLTGSVDEREVSIAGTGADALARLAG